MTPLMQHAVELLRDNLRTHEVKAIANILDDMSDSQMIEFISELYATDSQGEYPDYPDIEDISEEGDEEEVYELGVPVTDTTRVPVIRELIDGDMPKYIDPKKLFHLPNKTSLILGKHYDVTIKETEDRNTTTYLGAKFIRVIRPQEILNTVDINAYYDFPSGTEKFAKSNMHRLVFKKRQGGHVIIPVNFSTFEDKFRIVLANMLEVPTPQSFPHRGEC